MFMPKRHEVIPSTFTYTRHSMSLKTIKKANKCLKTRGNNGSKSADSLSGKLEIPPHLQVVDTGMTSRYQNKPKIKEEKKLSVPKLLPPRSNTILAMTHGKLITLDL